MFPYKGKNQSLDNRASRSTEFKVNLFFKAYNNRPLKKLKQAGHKFKRKLYHIKNQILKFHHFKFKGNKR